MTYKKKTDPASEERFICAFSFLISLSFTLANDQFKNHFTISPNYFDMIFYWKYDPFFLLPSVLKYIPQNNNWTESIWAPFLVQQQLELNWLMKANSERYRWNPTRRGIDETIQNLDQTDCQQIYGWNLNLIGHVTSLKHFKISRCSLQDTHFYLVPTHPWTSSRTWVKS